MAVTNKEIKRFSIIILILLLVVLSYIILKPIMLSVIAGLLLAYMFLPVYRPIFRIFREKNTSALAVCVLILLIIFIPLWFLTPVVIQQGFDFYKLVQSSDVGSIIQSVLPTSSPQVQREIIAVLDNFVGNVTSFLLNALANLLLELPTVLLNIAVIIFVFFFTLRDKEKLKNFLAGISPFKKEREKELIVKFRDMTSSIVFGYILVGVIQGIATGIGLFIFGVPKPLLLTFFAIFASILPMVGPWLIWLPAALYLFTIGHTGAAIGFLIYSVFFVSLIDNFLRPYLVARKVGVPSVIVLVGMIGGLLVFGIMGIILGPLILAYLVIFLEAYKNKTLTDMFSSDD